jgi:hypothetical protein
LSLPEATRNEHLSAFSLLMSPSSNPGESTFQFISPVLAQSTAAGTAIKNTATGTFSDATTIYLQYNF